MSAHVLYRGSYMSAHVLYRGSYMSAHVLMNLYSIKIQFLEWLC